MFYARRGLRVLLETIVWLAQTRRRLNEKSGQERTRAGALGSRQQLQFSFRTIWREKC